tara:strand:- start:517 stop:726 length:210 start_codon:yes stop_codon:yes gene_type:complete
MAILNLCFAYCRHKFLYRLSIGLIFDEMGSYAKHPKEVWEFHMDSSSEKIMTFSLNTQPGEIRKHDAHY